MNWLKWSDASLISAGAPKLMFSTWGQGFTKDPARMSVPIDDHGFHRGDGVFEAIRVVNYKAYLLEAHLQRMNRSASRIGLKSPLEIPEIKKIIEFGIKESGMEHSILRLFLTRGPGSFGVSPAESSGSQLFIVWTPFVPVRDEKYKAGVRVGLSQIPMKPGFFPQVKSLNYLPNVLMKAEALQLGFDFMVNKSEADLLAEGPTENLVVIKSNGSLCYPSTETILLGCTMDRLFSLIEQKNLGKTERGVPLRMEDVRAAKEAFLIGTTLDVLPISEFAGHKFSGSFPMCEDLRQLLRTDQLAADPQ